MQKHLTDWRPLIFAACGLAMVIAISTGPHVFAGDRHLQTVPTATPRTTLPTPGLTAVLRTPGVTPGPGTPVSTSPAIPTAGAGTGGLEGLVFREEVSHQDVLPGDQVVYKLWLSNDTDTAVTGLVVMDRLDAALRPIEVSATQGTAKVEGQVLALSMGVLEPKQAAAVVIHTVVRSSVSAGYVIVNQAIAYHDTGQVFSNLVPIALPPDRLPATGHD